MLGLKLPTDPRWVDLAEMSYEEILTDHAYCEQKAASASISLIQRYPEKTRLVDELVPIVSEEWGHFKMVLDQLKKRKLQLGPQRKDEYVHLLMKGMKKSGQREKDLKEHLLIMAMIEARSCERFKLLSQKVADEDLRQFYKKLMVSEAGHYKLFIDLAIHYFDKSSVMARWNEMLEHEKEIMQQLELRGDRMH